MTRPIAALDSSIGLFSRQYFQQLDNLQFPPSIILKQADVQASIYQSMFNAEGAPHLPPQRYQRRVLKALLDKVERAVEDPEQDEISDELMEHMASLSTGIDISPLEAVQQRSCVVYTLPSIDILAESKTLLIHESRNLISASGTTGMRTWGAALHLGTFLVGEGAEIVRGKAILELGAGTGFLSILCALVLDAGFVLSTDGSRDVVNMIDDNIALNKELQPDLEASNVESRVLEWGAHSVDSEALRSNNKYNHFDVAIGADVTYGLDSIGPLIETMKNLFDIFSSIRIVICATIRNEATFRCFTEACGLEGWRSDYVEFDCPPVHEQTGFFHHLVPPIVILQITSPALAMAPST